MNRPDVHVFLTGFLNEKFGLTDWRWSVWLAGGWAGGRRPQLG